MKTSELIKKLKRAGCFAVRSGGNHDIRHSPITDKDFAGPRHPNKEIPTGTAAKIMKDAGISYETK